MNHPQSPGLAPHQVPAHVSQSNGHNATIKLQARAQGSPISGSSSPTKMHRDVIENLLASPNTFAAGVGEILQAFLSTEGSNNKPVIVELVMGIDGQTKRRMAMGRQRLGCMNGRAAMLYIKTKFGLLNSAAPLYLEAKFDKDEEKYTEIDMDSWEELIGHISLIQIIG
ncbi:hypothetical protein BJ165DRAFT_1401728 [Panaeolus papilionaceus]|nr:hypothetical protein BJ165DRAFT_1401728 [Panaeolus papilionaceus]